MVRAVPAADSVGAARRAASPLISLIIPAYNEARRIPASLAACAQFFTDRALAAEVIVADDGSTDGTADAFGQTVLSLAAGPVRFRYLRLPHRGKGGAVRAGVFAAEGDPIMFFDSDLSIPLDLVDTFRAEIARGADVAVASRYVPGSTERRPWWRRVMGVVFRACVHLIVPVDVSDTQCGGKAYTAEAARDLFRRSHLDSFAFDAEILFLARRMEYRVREVPFHLTQDRVTSINFMRDVPRMLRDLFAIRIDALLGRYR